MPTYKYTDSKTGESIKFKWEGENPPSPSDFDRIFKEHKVGTIKDSNTTKKDGTPERDLRWQEGGIGQTFERELSEAGNSLADLIKDPTWGKAAMAPLDLLQGAFSPLTAVVENIVGQPIKEGIQALGAGENTAEFTKNLAENAAYMISPSQLLKKRLIPEALKLTESIPHKVSTSGVKQFLDPLKSDISAIPTDRIATAASRVRRAEPGVEAGGIGYGQELPKYAAGNTGVNLAARSGNDTDTMYLINRVAEQNKETMLAAKGGDKRGVKTWEKTKKGGEELLEGLGEKKDIIIQNVARKTDDIDSWMYAANQVLKNEFEDLKKMIITAVDSGIPEEIEKVKPYMQQVVQTMAEVGGAGSKLGRALNAQKIMSSSQANWTGIIDAIQKADLPPELLRGMADMKPWELGKFLRGLTRPTTWDYIKSAWYNSILSGIPTHIVNTTSNTAWQGAQVPYKAVRGAIDMGASAVTGKQRDFYIREALPNLMALRTGLRGGVAKGLQALKHGIVLGDSSKLDIAHIAPWTFSPNPLMRKLAPFVEAPSRLLQASDSFFKGIAYEAEKHALATRFALKEGKKGADLQRRILELADDEHISDLASQYAKYVTFTDEPGVFTKKLLNLREGTNVGKALTFIIPFISTPANIMKRGLEMTPGLGAIPHTWKAFQGQLSKAQAVETIAKQAIGCGVGALFASKYGDGEITGAMPTDPTEIDEWVRQRKQPWSVKIGDKWFEYRRWEPFNTGISAVVSLLDRIKNKPDAWGIDDVLSATSGITKNFLNVSYMSQLASLIEAIEDPKSEKINGFLAQFGSSFIPYSSMLRTVGKMTDLVKLEDGTVGSPKKDPKGLIEGIKSQLPGLRKDVPNKLDYLGQPKISEGGWLQQFLPFKWTKENQDTMETELRKSETKVGRLNDMIDGKKLTREQYYLHRQTTGHILKERLEALTASPSFKDKSQEDKDEMIKETMRDAREDGREKMRQILQTQASNTIQDEERRAKVEEPLTSKTFAGMDPGNMFMAGGTALAGALAHKPGMIRQAIKSALTSVAKVPRSFKYGEFKPGSVNADIGGGRHEVGSVFMRDKKGVTNIVVDPHNRSAEHNAAAQAALKANPADTATVNDVLNVIKEPAVREDVIKQAKDAIKPEGVVYFQMYHGDKSGIGKVTKVDKKTGEALNWQNNLHTKEYVDEIRNWFDDVFVYKYGKGQNDFLVVAKEPRQTKNLFKTFKAGTDMLVDVEAKGRVRKPKVDYWRDGIKSGRFGQETADYIKNIRKMQGETAMHLNSKTKFSVDFDTLCPMRDSGIGSCPYCYVEHGRLVDRLFKMKGGNKALRESTPYRGEIKHMPQEMIDDLNRDGGIRMFSFSDYQDKHYEQVAQVLSDAYERGLMVKAITKQKKFVDTFGDYPSLRINISTDMLPRHMSNAPTVEDALLWKAGRENIKIRAVALNKTQAIRAGNDPNVSVVTLYHGLTNKKGQLWEIIKEQNPGLIAKVGKEAVLKEINTWEDFRYDRKTFKELQKMFPNKICCQGGKCSKDPTKCGFAPIGLGALIPGVWIPMSSNGLPNND